MALNIEYDWEFQQIVEDLGFSEEEDAVIKGIKEYVYNVKVRDGLIALYKLNITRAHTLGEKDELDNGLASVRKK